MQKIIISLLVVFSFSFIQAQELNCVVSVNARQIEGSERTMFENMQKAIFQLVNGRKWTNDEYKVEERIDCSILINLSQWVIN